MIDLHTHSLFSDGTATPAQLVDKAASVGLSAIALTDHDSADGLTQFQSAAKLYPDLLVLNGAELGIDFKGDEYLSQLPDKPVVEIIAMNFQDTEPFCAWGKRINHYREEANIKRVEKLRALGLYICFDDVIYDENGHKRNMVGKPHIAAALLKKRYISSMQEAFEKYLNKGLPAYVKQQNPNEIETLDFILQNGAIPIMPHPCLTKTKGQDLYNLIKYLKKNGLMGIEVFHSEHTPAQMKEYFEIAKDLNLIISGGSDFHGRNKPDIELGIGKGNLNIPDSVLEPILARSFRHINYQSIEKALTANAYRFHQ